MTPPTTTWKLTTTTSSSYLPPFDPVQSSALALLRAQSHPIFLAQTIRLLLFLFLVFFEPEHENGTPVVIVFLEQPVVHVPRDLHGNPIEFDFLVASEFPLYALYLQVLYIKSKASGLYQWHGHEFTPHPILQPQGPLA
jgi:hypothetical protein